MTTESLGPRLDDPASSVGRSTHNLGDLFLRDSIQYPVSLCSTFLCSWIKLIRKKEDESWCTHVRISWKAVVF